MAESPEQAERILSRRTVGGSISMWGTMHVNRHNRRVVGWIVDTWTESGIEPHLTPRMLWVSREDGKFHNMGLQVDVRSVIRVFDEATNIEPHRAAFIKATLALWEQEWLEQGTPGL
jgi:hypothetical protein